MKDTWKSGRRGSRGRGILLLIYLLIGLAPVLLWNDQAVVWLHIGLLHQSPKAWAAIRLPAGLHLILAWILTFRFRAMINTVNAMVDHRRFSTVELMWSIAAILVLIGYVLAIRWATIVL
jgi:hypothetical protein